MWVHTHHEHNNIIIIIRNNYMYRHMHTLWWLRLLLPQATVAMTITWPCIARLHQEIFVIVINWESRNYGSKQTDPKGEVCLRSHNSNG